MGNKCLNQNDIAKSVVLQTSLNNEENNKLINDTKFDNNYEANLSIRSLQESFVQQNGAKYKGNLVDGKKQGEGKLYYDNGFVLKANFQNDQVIGDVVYENDDGYMYEGQWLDDNPHGKGKETLNDKSYYKGDFNKGLKHGKGYYQWDDLSTYNGEWKDDQINGYVYQKGNICMAQWGQICRKLVKQLKTWLWQNVLPKIIRKNKL